MIYTLTSIEQYNDLVASGQDFVVFKDSATCGLSQAAHRVVYNRSDTHSDVAIYTVDVLGQPDLKYHIADATGITHHSPQLIVYRDGQVTADVSHRAITLEWLDNHL